MRLIVLFLLLANLAFYAFHAGYFDRLPTPEAEQPIRPVNAEALKVLAMDEERPVETPAAAVPVAPADPVTPAAPVAPAADVAAANKLTTGGAVPTPEACLSWQLSEVDAERLAKLLAQDFPGFSMERQKAAASGGNWWVFLPLSGEKADADRKRRELTQLGVLEHFAIAEAPGRFVISLGVYSTEKAAQASLDSLQRKGVDGVRLVQRGAKGAPVRVEAWGAAERRDKLAEAVRRQLPDAKLKACP